MLVALATLAGRHALALGAVGSLSLAANRLVFEVVVGFADRAGSLLGLLRSIQRHAARIAGQVAVSRVILFSFLRSIHGLSGCAEGSHCHQYDGEKEDALHHTNEVNGLES